MNEKLEELRKYMKSIDPEKHPNAVLMNSVDKNKKAIAHLHVLRLLSPIDE